MRFSRDDHGFDRVATLDIETTHYDPTEGETVSIGIGVHDRGTPAEEATYRMLHRNGNGEEELISQAEAFLNDSGADGLVSFKGRDFDLDFLNVRSYALGQGEISVNLSGEDTHVDLFEGRKEEAERRNDKWPNLEECIEAYDWTPAKTIWGNSLLTNTRFGEDLGPTYLEALDVGDDEQRQALLDVIEHYLVTDLEANFAVYYGDIGEEFEPQHLGTEKTFSA